MRHTENAKAHFVVAVWRAKETECGPREGLETHPSNLNGAVRVILGAKAERYVGRTFIGETPVDRTKHYYWLQPVSLEGQEQLTQNLSNNSLTSTTGTSALIHTTD